MKNFSKFLKFSLLSFFISCIVSLSANAQTKKISLQGFLKDANGKAVADGIQALTFKIYTVASGGTALWSEDQSLKVVGGVYAAQLGSVTDISALSWNVPYFVGVTVQGVELTPRTELTYAPYSFGTNKAQIAQEVICSGAVGDVKYSILNPTKFKDVNGDCWVPMDGRNIASSKLAVIMGVTNVPNGGGLFLRGQENSNTDFDADRNNSSAIATLQDQATQTHQHDFSGTTSPMNESPTKVYYSIFNRSGWSIPLPADVDNYRLQYGGNSGGDGLFPVFKNIDLRGTFTGTTGSSNTGTGPETRPKNLNFWTYIRIN